MRLIGRRRRESVLRDGSLAGLTRTLHPGERPSVLPGWEVIATPGHTPGHVSFFRPTDRILISGDALVTVELNSVSGLLRRRTGLSGPPWYTTWDRAAAAASVRRLAELNPTVLASGHGTPFTSPETAHRIRQFGRQHEG
jgi:glyoxylase-like metal-dependent hydrolase (beta-lactamase superfamily II)